MKPPPPILPLVANHQPRPGHCPLGAGLRFTTATSPQPLAAASSAALQALRDTWEAGPAAMDAPRCDIRIDPAAEHPGEGYEILIDPARITIEAGDEAGFFYAIQSLRQLLTLHADRGALPAGRVQDAPRFPWRGFLLDSARHFQPVDWILRHLDRMAALKLNRLHWHLSDDQGWRAQVRRYPRLTDVAAWRGSGEHRHGGFYTHDQMRRVVAHARRLNITVIPEIEMPGHCNAALLAYPELGCSGEPLPVADAGWDAYTRLAGRRAFCAGREEVYTFLGHVLEEIDEVFDPPYLHIGGDETPRSMWDACPRCLAAMKEHGCADSSALRVAFLNRVAAFCRDRLGKPTVAWTDGVAEALPADQLVHAWFPGEAATAARLGRSVINSNHEWTYLDYPATQRDAARKPGWMIVLPLEKVYHFDPLPDGLEPALAERILGAEAPLWTEHAPDAAEFERQLMPRLAAFAEALWSPRMGRSFDDFERRLDLHAGLGTFDLPGRQSPPHGAAAPLAAAARAAPSPDR